MSQTTTRVRANAYQPSKRGGGGLHRLDFRILEKRAETGGFRRIPFASRLKTALSALFSGLRFEQEPLNQKNLPNRVVSVFSSRFERTASARLVHPHPQMPWCSTPAFNSSLRICPRIRSPLSETRAPSPLLCMGASRSTRQQNKAQTGWMTGGTR